MLLVPYHKTGQRVAPAILPLMVDLKEYHASG
jgi:hypothetical protein